KGVDVRMLPSRDGAVLFDDIEQLIDSRTRLIAISSVQFQNGYRIDLQRLGELCAAKSVHLCVDAIQSLGAFPLDVKRYGIDFLAADGHKWLLSPEGIGIFFCRPERAAQLYPPLVGWKSVENEHDFDDPSFHLKKNAQRFEEGSLNVLGIIALGASLELLFEVGIDRIAERVQDLGDIIIREGEKRGFELKSPRKREDRGGIVSLGGNFDPLYVRDLLKERGIMVNVRGGALRLSPHFYNTEAEVLRCFQEVDDILTTK
ncbi:MAG TPA: aminotransferase, partial [Nitrospiraceae bacterium]|nr:aminotransferase [Nitrospiraceae bacterium]